jgi:hypothetical protein
MSVTDNTGDPGPSTTLNPSSLASHSAHYVLLHMALDVPQTHAEQAEAWGSGKQQNGQQHLLILRQQGLSLKNSEQLEPGSSSITHRLARMM